MSSYGMNYGYAPQQQSYGPVASSPNYTGGSLYGYNNNPYGLYGQNPSYTLAESPYARLTNQPTQMSSQAIPNLSSYLQPMMVDMNSFLGNRSGIPAYPSFIGSTAMMNSNQPLYQTYQDYANAQQQQQQQNYGYQQPSYGYQQPSYGYQQQPSYGYMQQQPSYGYMQQPSYGCMQQNPFMSMNQFPGTMMSSFAMSNSFQQTGFSCFC